jgi:aldose 1-epimerase
MKINKKPFGKIDDGRQADLITIENDSGVICKITNFGGILTSWIVPDKKGKPLDIVLGWDHLEKFVADTSYLGAIIGRYGNRIARGTFTLEGRDYQLAVNQPPNHLHGGIKGFNKVLWDYSIIDTPMQTGIKLKYLSHDMEEGYPGNLNVEVIYTLNNEGELKIEYTATTDKTTHVNLTNHAYFNLNGCRENILRHHLKLFADQYTPVDKTLIPTGEIATVKGTDLDFTEMTEIGSRIKNIDIGGYDHNYVLNKKPGVLEKIAEVKEPDSGLKMDVFTTEPGVQFYAAINLDGSLVGKGNIRYDKYFAFCLETQHFPDSPNKPRFPSTILNPWETYAQTTIYKVSVDRE